MMIPNTCNTQEGQNYTFIVNLLLISVVFQYILLRAHNNNDTEIQKLEISLLTSILSCFGVWEPILHSDL